MKANITTGPKFWAKFTQTLTITKANYSRETVQHTLLETTDPDEYMAMAKDLGFDKASAKNARSLHGGGPSLSSYRKPPLLNALEREWLGRPVRFNGDEGVVTSLSPSPKSVWVFFPNRTDYKGQPWQWSDVRVDSLVIAGRSQRQPVTDGGL